MKKVYWTILFIFLSIGGIILVVKDIQYKALFNKCVEEKIYGESPKIYINGIIGECNYSKEINPEFFYVLDNLNWNKIRVKEFIENETRVP